MSIIKERVTSQYPIVAISHVFTSAFDEESDPIDTAGYEDGVYFAMTGIFPSVSNTNMAFEHSHTTDPGDFVAVDFDNVVYARKGETPLAALYNVDNNSGVTKNLQGLPCVREGLRNTRRYVRVVVKPNSYTGVYVTVFAVLDSETWPTPGVLSYTFPADP